MSDRLKSETSCDALVDATNTTTRGGGGPSLDYMDGPQPIAFAAAEYSSEDESNLAFDAPPQLAGAPPPIQANVANRIASSSGNVLKSSGGGEIGPVEEIEVPQIDLRSYFPETWLFDLANLDGSGQYSWEVNAPHTVTTWIGEAFCTSDATGLTTQSIIIILIMNFDISKTA